MLNKEWVSGITIYSDDWFNHRLSKLTASEWHYCMSEKFLTEGCLNYLYRKVGEEMTGIPSRDDIFTEATNHGNLYEPEALKLFGQKQGLDFLVTQKMIYRPESRFSCTPDGLIVSRESPDKLEYEVSTVEVKCPLSYDGYIKLFLCDTPEDVKKVDKKYYWQVCFQMEICKSLAGFLVVYHPHFKAGQMKIIRFRMAAMIDEFKLLKDRMRLAESKFIEIRDKLLVA